MAKIAVLKDGFTAGELTPLQRGSPGKAGYALGVAESTNWFVDYRGGLSTRPGTKFVDFIKEDDKDVRLVPFIFSPSAFTNFSIMFGHNYIRFVQNGSYVLESAVTVTGVTNASPRGVVTAAAHGFANGDWVKFFDVGGVTELAQRTFQVSGVTTNTFTLDDTYGNAVDTTAYGTYTSGGTVRRIYTLVSTYAGADVFDLSFSQSRSQLVITHPLYVARKLDRISDANWSLATVNFGNATNVPTGLAATPSTAGTAGVGFLVTSVDVNNIESLASQVLINELIVDYSTVAGSCRFTWAAVADAIYYRIYRTSIIPVGAEMTRSMPLGLIGESFGPDFVDDNITPDFTQAPPQYSNPFANGAVEYIQVTAGGTGYAKGDTVSISVGSGFEGFPIINSAGVLLAVIVTKGGSGYDGTSALTITTSGGTGAAVTLSIGAASGNNPSTSTVFQQRRVYGATINEPLTFWASQPGQHELFDVARLPVASDAYEYELDSPKVAPLRHMLSTRTGLVLFTQSAVWHITAQGAAVTGSNATATLQLSTGSSTVPPLQIGTDLVFIEGQGQGVKLLTYSDYQRLYVPQDISITASHLLQPSNPVTSWSYAPDPYKLIHAVRADGKLLTQTLVKEQEVFAWSVYETRGKYKDVLTVPENTTDGTYYIVERYINGSWAKFLEKEADRSFSHVEDAWCVDCGLGLEPTYPDATITAAAASGTGVSFTLDSASAFTFSAGDVGSYIRFGGGKALIVSYVNTREVLCDFERDITNNIPTSAPAQPYPAELNTWTLDAPVTVLSNLWHLEGETVKILADGNVLVDGVVSGGQVTIPVAATRVIIGLGYDCVVKTLPPSSPDVLLESREVRIINILIRLYESRGLKIGASLSTLKVMKERLNEPYGQATLTQSGVSPITLSGKFEYEPGVYYVQDEPLPATLLALVSLVESSND